MALSNNIVVAVKGGLGNQLFQYAFALNAKFLNINSIIFFDLSFFSSSHQKYPRELSLNKFTLPIELNELNAKLPRPNIISRTYDFLRKRSFFKKMPVSVQNLFYYLNFLFGNKINEIFESGYVSIINHSIKWNISDLRIYSGYWADTRYFESVIQILKGKIKLKKQSEFLLNQIGSIKPEDILIHIRRGDYLKIGSGNEGIFLGLAYYVDAIANFKKTSEFNKNSKFWIFTDDYDWCTNVFVKNFKDINFDFSASLLDDVESFELMRHFSNRICANSTYSLWANFLSYKENRFVVFPDKWIEEYRKLGYNILGPL